MTTDLVIQKDKVYNLEEVALYLRVSQQTVTRQALKKKLKAFKVGTSWRFTGKAILKYTGC